MSGAAFEGSYRFPNGTLVSTPHLEVENAYFLSNDNNQAIEIRQAVEIGRAFRECAADVGFSISENTAHSVYLDVAQKDATGITRPTLGLFGNGLTLRLRGKGDSKCAGKVDEKFSDQIAVKRRNRDFQLSAYEIAKRLHPEAATLGVYPYIRDEIEGEHKKKRHPEASDEMRFEDLPTWERRKNIRKIFNRLVKRGKIERVAKAKDLVFKPIVTTTVDRQRIKMYIDPTKPIDFKEHWPYSEPTDAMKKSGSWICLEVSIDYCVNRSPKDSVSIDALVGAEANAFGSFSKSCQLIEYEMKHGLHGTNTTDAQAVDAYIRFGLALQAWVREGWGYNLQPTRSKAVNAIGSLPECGEGGRLSSSYLCARDLAP